MKAGLAILGALPFVFGGLMDWFMTAYPDVLPPYALIGVLVLLVWGAMAYLAKAYIKSTKTVVICLNLIAFLVLILLAVQELILRAYWLNAVGTWTQFFYLPLINIGFRLTPWSHSVFSAYFAAFLLMAAVSFLGCKVRKQ